MYGDVCSTVKEIKVGIGLTIHFRKTESHPVK